MHIADWIEHAMETEGAAYLRPPLDDLSFITQHSLDVILFWVLCGTLPLLAVSRCLRKRKTRPGSRTKGHKAA